MDDQKSLGGPAFSIVLISTNMEWLRTLTPMSKPSIDEYREKRAVQRIGIAKAYTKAEIWQC